MSQKDKFLLWAGIGAAIGAIFTAALTPTQTPPPPKTPQKPKPTGDFMDYYRLAEMAFQSGQYEKALSNIQLSLELNDDFAPAFNMAARILLEWQFSATDTLPLIHKAIDLEKGKGVNMSAYLLTLAEIHYKLEDYQQVKEIAQNAIQILPDFHQYPGGHLHALLGRCHSILGEIGPALTHFQKASQIEPKWTDLPIEIGKIYIQLTNWKEAYSYFLIAKGHLDQQENTPESRNIRSWILENLGWISMQLGELERAESYAQEAHLISLSLPGPCLVLAAVAALNNSYELFESHLNNAFNKINVHDPSFQHYILRITHEPAFVADPYKAYSLERLYHLQLISRIEFEEYRQYAIDNSRHSMEHHWIKLEKLVEKDQIESFCSQIKQLLQQYGEEFTSIIESATLLLGTLHKTKEQELRGVLSNETIRLDYNKLRVQAIQLLKESKKLWNLQIHP